MMHQRLIEAFEDVGNEPTPLLVWNQGAMFPNEAWMRLDAEGNVQFGAEELPTLHYDLIWGIAGEMTRGCLGRLANDPIVAKLLQAVYAGYEVVKDGSGFRVDLTQTAGLARRALWHHIEANYNTRPECLDGVVVRAHDAVLAFDTIYTLTPTTLRLFRRFECVEAAENWLRELDRAIGSTPLTRYHARSLERLRNDIENDVDGALSRFARLWGAAYAIYETGEYPARAAVAAVGLPVEEVGGVREGR